MRIPIALFMLFIALSGQPGRAVEQTKPSAVSVVLLSEPRLLDARKFRDNLEKRLAGRVKVVALERDDRHGIVVKVDRASVFVRLMASPLPKGQIDDLCGSAWYWKGACEVTSKHQAQAIVGISVSEMDKLDMHLLLTDAVVASMDNNAIASYWLSSLQSRDAFVRQATPLSRDAPPVWLWVNFRISSDVNKGFSLSTSGMDRFGLREIEAKDIKRPGKDVFSLLHGMAQYLITNGPVIKDGESIGDSPKEGIKVQQGPSYWREGLTVYRVAYPQ
jgi:hypothetical protein